MNRKKRKLNFIRLKNAVRRGHAFYVQTKLSWLAMGDSSFIHSECAHWQKHWSRVYKLPIDLVRVDIYMSSTDIIQETMTVQFIYRYLPYVEDHITVNNYTSYANKRRTIERGKEAAGQAVTDNVGILRRQGIFSPTPLEIPGLEFGSTYPFMSRSEAGGSPHDEG